MVTYGFFFFCFLFSGVTYPPKTQAADLNLRHLNIAIRHCGFSDDLKDHPRACHNLMGVPPKNINWTQRETKAGWVGRRPNDKNLLLLEAAHGIKDPLMKEFEARIRAQAEEGDSEARKVVEAVDGFRAQFAEYSQKLKEDEDTRLETMRIREQEIEEVVVAKNLPLEEKLLLYGIALIPADTTPMKGASLAKAAGGAQSSRQVRSAGSASGSRI
jgi:hypothetical protein